MVRRPSADFRAILDLRQNLDSVFAHQHFAKVLTIASLLQLPSGPPITTDIALHESVFASLAGARTDFGTETDWAPTLCQSH